MLNDLLRHSYQLLTGATVLLTAINKPFAMAFHICNYLILKMSVLNKIHSKNSANKFYHLHVAHHTCHLYMRHAVNLIVEI